jgi:coatomer subunit beta
MEFISENHGPSAVDVIAFVREVMEKFPGFRKDILKRMLPILGDITTSRVYRGALWIVGEYSDDPHMILEAFACIRDVIGDLPILKEEDSTKEEGDEKKPLAPGVKVLSDGTYATESAFVNRTSRAGRHFRHPFRGNFVLKTYF